MIRVAVAAAFLATAAVSCRTTTAASSETQKQKAERMEWFSQAKLGIFIHWGIYSRGDWSESWPLYNSRVTPEDYYAQQADFTAADYNPEEWVSLIKESGAKYTVITSKHHDGVALWDTGVGELSTVRTCAAGRDVLTPFVDEVRRQGGLKLGLYYSLIDWSHKDYPFMHRDQPAVYDIDKDTERWQRFCDFNFAQMKELNDAYHPDLYWFDGDWDCTSEQWRAPELVAMVRRTNPGVILNSRIQGNGDYATPELGVPVVRPQDQWWETCMTINDSWGYRKQDTYYKSNITLLRMLVNCMSLGGNLLLDIGPRADGTIPQEEADALRYIGRWVKKHEEAVYPTRAGIPDGHVQAYTTLNQAGDVLYVYLPYTPNETVEVKGLKTRVKNVRVVGTDRTLSWTLYNDIDWSEVPGVYYIDVPEDVVDEAITVLALELDGPLELYRGSGQVMTFNNY